MKTPEVLLVDHDFPLAGHLAAALAAAGYRVNRVADGATALASAAGQRPALVIGTEHQPGLGHGELRQRLAAHAAAIPALLIDRGDQATPIGHRPPPAEFVVALVLDLVSSHLGGYEEHGTGFPCVAPVTGDRKVLDLPDLPNGVGLLARFATGAW